MEKCLASVDNWASEIVVVDSQSTDCTLEIAHTFGAHVLQFHYAGGWPKKRNWSLQTHPWKNDWVLLLDADEILLDPVKQEIELAISDDQMDGYWINFQIVFLGRMLRYGDTNLWKLSLFRHSKGRYERRLADQDASMADMEIHEHVEVRGKVGRLRNPIRHENVNTLAHYIHKHNQYSNWEAGVFLRGEAGSLKPSLFGSQAQRRRALKRMLLGVPGFPFIVFLYTYIFKLGWLDGKPGFYYSLFRYIQLMHVKAKIYESTIQSVTFSSQSLRKQQTSKSKVT